MEFKKKEALETLRKSLHRVIAKAYKNGNSTVLKALDGMPNKQHSIDHIMADIEDKNDVAQVPADHIPASAEAVLNKESDPQKEISQDLRQVQHQKEQNAKAQLGQMEIKSPQNEVNMSEKPEKGIMKLKKFIDGRLVKSNQQPNEKEGISNIGSMVRTANFNKEHGYKEAAKNSMRQAVDEKKNDVAREKQQPKLNLPKSEMAKANKFESHASSIKAPDGEIRRMLRDKSVDKMKQKGTHEPLSSKSGNSKAGQSTKSHANTHPNKHTPAGLKDYHKDMAVMEHKKVLNEMRKQPKPNLPKSEAMNKANKFESKAGLKGQDTALKMVRATNPNSGPKGVHNSFGGKGVSQMGQANLGNWSSGNKPMNQKVAKEQAVKILNQSKAMPKPNLPKSEKINKVK